MPASVIYHPNGFPVYYATAENTNIAYYKAPITFILDAIICNCIINYDLYLNNIIIVITSSLFPLFECV